MCQPHLVASTLKSKQLAALIRGELFLFLRVDIVSRTIAM